MSTHDDQIESRSARTDDDRDAELLARVIKRDRAALTELYTRYYHPLLRFIYRITGDVDSAQEGVNDVMLVVWSSGARFDGRSRVGTWIMGIAYRKALKLRKLSRRWTDRFKAAEWTEQIEPRTDASELTDDRPQRALTQRAMKALPPKQRAVVELTYLHGLSYEEIAAIVECPVNTVKTRMFHARAKLRQALSMLDREDLDL